jgi:hypothetical protein
VQLTVCYDLAPLSNALSPPHQYRYPPAPLLRLLALHQSAAVVAQSLTHFDMQTLQLLRKLQNQNLPLAIYMLVAAYQVLQKGTG